MSARKIRPPNKPMWMNREISRAMDKKRRLWRRRVPAEDYKAAEKKVRNLVRNTKRNFAKKLTLSNGNSKPFYSYLKNKTQSRSVIGPMTREDSTLTSDNKKMAGILKQFFSSVFTTEDPTVKVPPAERDSTGTTKLASMCFRVKDTQNLIK